MNKVVGILVLLVVVLSYLSLCIEEGEESRGTLEVIVHVKTQDANIDIYLDGKLADSEYVYVGHSLRVLFHVSSGEHIVKLYVDNEYYDEKSVSVPEGGIATAEFTV